MTPVEATILVVEDKRIVALDLQRTLVSLGYNAPVVVRSGDEALAFARMFRLDLVLIDLPVKGSADGCETVRELRKLGQFALICLAVPHHEQRLRAQNGAHHVWLPKPFTREQLERALERVLPRL